MFDYVRNSKLLVQVILGLIIAAFALWGVESYRAGGTTAGVAEVNGSTITQREFEDALRRQQDQLRQVLGSVDAATLDNPELRRGVLDNLIQQRLLVERAARLGFAIPDAQLADVIRQIEAFQRDGQFSQERYEALLRQQGMTPIMFEEQLRQELKVRQLADPYLAQDFVTQPMVERLVAVLEQKREISRASVAAESFLDKVSVDDAEAKAYYETRTEEFRVPEQVRVDYLVLSADALAGRIEVSEDELKAYYEAHRSEFGVPEERKASHILITVPAGAGEEERAKARRKAEELAAQAKKEPSRFAELAKTHSQDPGSAGNGGDLGSFRRGVMVKPFDDAVFAMTEGEIRGPVETEFGYHVIKLEAIKPSTVPAFEQARADVLRAVRTQKAARRLAEAAESFSNLVYEQPESLQPAADALGLTVQSSGWITRSGENAPFPVNPRLLDALFGPDAVKDKRNTEAIEVAPNTLVAARVTEHKAASRKPFDEVERQIVARLKREKAAALAAKEGAALLEKLRKGESVKLEWTGPSLVSRQEAAGVPPAALRGIFQAEKPSLPAYVGEDGPTGYTIYRVSGIVEADPADEAKRAAYAAQLSRMLGQEEYAAFLASVRRDAEIEVNQRVLAPPQ
ncbi:MAG TPA: SurA N-terminal domain-containing protein [Pelomicrobium sp.]|nr:SurA N-terminal domain-containing protein [Pelomicrobium sp.]